MRLSKIQLYAENARIFWNPAHCSKNRIDIRNNISNDISSDITNDIADGI